MHRWAKLSALGVCIALGSACDEDTEVQRQTRELERAQKEVPEVTAKLEEELAETQAKVIELESKLALARQGLTDDVIENQRELEQALSAQQEQVRTELDEAKREAMIHDRDTAAALKQLQQTSAASAPPAEPVAASPAPAPPQPSASAEPVHPDEVLRVSGAEADAGVELRAPAQEQPAPHDVPGTGPASAPAPENHGPAAPPPAVAPTPSL